MRLVLQGGTVVGSEGMIQADVVIEDEIILEIRDNAARTGDRIIDCSGRYVMPGFVDAHSHADGLLADDGVQRALLKQGVTSIIAGQDGVSYAPGDGMYASQYFGAINGPHPSYSGGGVAEYLSAIDGTSRLNAAYLVPAGTVRWAVCGRSEDRASLADCEAMVALVDQGMHEGAVGISTGLDYVPGIFADTDEIAKLCEPVAQAGGVYVSHMRGGYEANSAVGINEIAAISEATGISVHVSHFHAEAQIVIDQLAALERQAVDATFDAYPYTRGCTLLTMPLLPPQLVARPVNEVLKVINDVSERARLRRDWFPEVDRRARLGPEWPGMITLAYIASSKYAWACGLTVADAAARVGTDAIDFSLDVLVASRLQVNAVVAVRYERPATELGRIFAHPAHVGGSDGIFIGTHPHPRARGTFARYLREYVRETNIWSWPDAVSHLSTVPAERFSLGRRGRIAQGWIADVIVVDPHKVADTATYESPLGEAVGIDDVLVAGVPVITDGELGPETPGRGLRREQKRDR